MPAAKTTMRIRMRLFASTITIACVASISFTSAATTDIRPIPPAVGLHCAGSRSALGTSNIPVSNRAATSVVNIAAFTSRTGRSVASIGWVYKTADGTLWFSSGADASDLSVSRRAFADGGASLQPLARSLTGRALIIRTTYPRFVRLTHGQLEALRRSMNARRSQYTPCFANDLPLKDVSDAQ